MADVTYIPDQQGQNNILPWMLASQNGGFGGMNNAWPWLFAMNGGGFGGFGGWGGAGLGGGILGFLLGALINNNGFGGLFGNGGGAGAGFLANQINNDSGRDLLMQAITSQGEASRTATQSLATMLGQDFNLVNTGVQGIRDGIAALTSQTGMSALQIVNAIQAGNSDLSSQLCKCCCDQRQLTVEQGYQNQLRTVEQTGALQGGIAGVRTAIESKAAADQLAMCQQTYALTDTMNRNFIALDNKIDGLESSRKDREITALTAKVAQLESQNFTTGVVGSAVAPINAALASLAKEVDDIKCKQPNTVPVPFPNLAAVNMTPYVSGGYYQGGINGYYGGGVPGFTF